MSVCKQENNILFSVIVPVYNSERYLTECVESILKQDYQDFEVILIDDGSTDDSPEICDRYEKIDSRIKVIHKNNEGETKARADGVRAASGEYIVCIDSDDWIDNGILEMSADVISKYNPDVITYGIRIEDYKGDIHKDIACRPGYYDKTRLIQQVYPYLIMRTDGKYFRPTVWGKIFRKTLFESNMIADSRVLIGGDLACTVPCIANAVSLYSLGKCYYNYRNNVQAVTKSHKVITWECCRAIQHHINNKVDLVKYDFKEQMYRLCAKQTWYSCYSLFYSGKPYKEVKKEILEYIENRPYSTFIKKAHFHGSWKASVMMKALKDRNILLIWMYARLRRY